MRQAFELAWLTGYLFNDSQDIKTMGMDRAHFSYSPKLGEALSLQSKVLFSQDKTFRVETKVTPLEDNKIILSRFNYTFMAPSVQADMKQVVPCTYDQGLEYLIGQR